MVFAYDSPQVIGALTQMAAWRQAGYQHDSWHFDGFKNGSVALAFGAMWLLASGRAWSLSMASCHILWLLARPNTTTSLTPWISGNTGQC